MKNTDKPNSELIVNANERETRVALLENNIVTELYIDRVSNAGIVGNIYLGKVTKVLPGMQAAFVNIGIGKAGFLYVNDVDILDILDEHEKLFMEEYDETEEEDNEFTYQENRKRRKGLKKTFLIEDILQEGQEILVQVAKNPIGTKGARLSSFISLPGRYLVFMPTIDQVAVSRRVKSEKEKRRLKKTIEAVKSQGSGYIVRTAAEGEDEREISNDAKFLIKLWENIKRKSDKLSAPAMAYKDLDLISRCLRDLDVKKVTIDSTEGYDRCIEFAKTYLNQEKDFSVEHYDSPEPIFEAYGLEIEINRALGSKVWLKSGGYIIIEQTEALVAIDINTGKYVGKSNHEATATKTNMESVKEIVYQLRLRNVGGLIIIDFIDMERRENREKVYNSLEKALTTDRSRTTILKVSELGIVEMARKRDRKSLGGILCQKCPYCEGRGEIRSTTTICYEIFREMQKLAISSSPKKKNIFISVHPKVADMLLAEENSYLEKIEALIKKKVLVKPDHHLHQEQYEVSTS